MYTFTFTDDRRGDWSRHIGPIVVEKNKQMAELPSLGKEYTVSFEMFINRFPTSWASILHIGLGGNREKYGDRNPGFWVSHDGVLYVGSSISGNKNLYTTNTVKEKRWIRVEASQTVRDGKVLPVHKSF